MDASANQGSDPYFRRSLMEMRTVTPVCLRDTARNRTHPTGYHGDYAAMPVVEYTDSLFRERDSNTTGSPPL